MTLLRHALRWLVRNPRRSLTTMTGAALAAGLVSAVLLFGIASETTVTRRALAEVPVDEQVVLAPGADSVAAQATIRSDPAVNMAIPFELVHFDVAERTTSGTATQTSSGVIVGLDPRYQAASGWFSTVSGSIEPGAMAISRDLASNLGATAGDTVSFTLPGGAAVHLRVSGILDTTGADLVLGPLDSAHRAAGANPPANVAAMRLGDLESAVASKVPPGAVVTDDTGGTSSRSVVPTTTNEPAVRRELHLQIDHAQVPGDPSAATVWLDNLRRRLDRQGAGEFQTVDDASAALEPIAADLAWGQVLFLFLALPGVLVALGLERLAAEATRDSTRRHVAWMRAHGAGMRTLIGVFVGSTVVATLVGAAVGFMIGTLAASILYGGDMWAAAGLEPVLEVGFATILGIAAVGAIVASASIRSDIARELAITRGELIRPTRPAWERFHLDLMVIALGSVALIAIPQIRPIVGTEGNPTVSLALSAFVAPCLLWIGLTLLVIRMGSWAARRRRVRASLGRAAGVAGDLAGASLAARSATIGPVVLVVALAIGFAVSVLVFDATYLEQQRVDARLTLGADLKAVPTAPVGPEAATTLSGPGIIAATPFVDRIVYVGPEAQDLLAIDPAGLPGIAPLSDSFFSGISADGAMAELRSQADGILVSAETARDYSMVPGDRVRIRIPDASGKLRQVDFRMLGIALEFPTAPKDAFLVANLDWVRRQTGNDRISFVLASANGDPLDSSRRLAQRLGPGWQVSDLTTITDRLANEVTSVDLGRLVLIDLAFALAIATIGFGLFLTAALSDRSRELATLAAIGAEPRQLLATISAEAAAIVATAILAGVTVGALIGTALVGVLNGVFDPAPPFPLVPAGPILGLIALTVASVAVTVFLFGRRFASLDLVGPLRVR